MCIDRVTVETSTHAVFPPARALMAPAPRKIVFNVPALLPDGTQAGGHHRRGPAPAGSSTAPSDGPADHGDLRKLGTIMEVGEALAGTLNLQAGLYSVLEVLG